MLPGDAFRAGPHRRRPVSALTHSARSPSLRAVSWRARPALPTPTRQQRSQRRSRLQLCRLKPQLFIHCDRKTLASPQENECLPCRTAHSAQASGIFWGASASQLTSKARPFSRQHGNMRLPTHRRAKEPLAWCVVHLLSAVIRDGCHQSFWALCLRRCRARVLGDRCSRPEPQT